MSLLSTSHTHPPHLGAGLGVLLLRCHRAFLIERNRRGAPSPVAATIVQRQLSSADYRSPRERHHVVRAVEQDGADL